MFFRQSKSDAMTGNTPYTFDAAFAEVSGAPYPALAPSPSRKWLWIRRGIAAGLLLFIMILLWLAVTAPLSKSLEPIAPPRITLLAADGTPIARNGAIVDRPVKATELQIGRAHV